jgi:hypothetical protein
MRDPAPRQLMQKIRMTAQYPKGRAKNPVSDGAPAAAGIIDLTLIGQ